MPISHSNQLTKLNRAAVLGGLDLAEAEKRLHASWKRSEQHYQIDRGALVKQRILSSYECKTIQEELASFLRIAQIGISRLHEQVRDSGYCVLLTNSQGVAVEFKGHPIFDQEFHRRGFIVGASWSELEEGTCGVGTAIVDGKPILVHRGEHFRVGNNGITCSAAPLFCPEGKLLGVLNASTFMAPEDRASQVLVYRLVQKNAAYIEDSLFIEKYKFNWIMSISELGGDWGIGEGKFIAFDESGKILSLSRHLRISALAGVDFSKNRISDLFNLSVNEFIKQAYQQPGAPISLKNLTTGQLFQAYVRAPNRESSTPRQALFSVPAGFEGIAVSDPRVVQIIDKVRKLVNHNLPILLLGETGSGKEAFAKAIHGCSQRHDKPFVAINCAAIPETLIESELFGYKEGAFTGAKSRGAKGKVQQSSGGTLFLDEIGDMPLQLQTRLLRLLEEKEVVPLGAIEPEKVDLNVICATHRDLAILVRNGQFREDLYYRLSGAILRLPPLRDRSDRREVIMHVFAEELKTVDRQLRLSDSLVELLANYSWPGNIRQLRNALRFAIALCDEQDILLDNFPEQIREGIDSSFETQFSRDIEAIQIDPKIDQPQLAEKNRIIEALHQTRWQVTSAAEQLGMSRATLYRRMSFYGILPSNNDN
ncbi:sigma-54-dependent Fis family transcriptional regulator [Ampullimonas aquatilis]|uniref:sigma-54-dependent Fis family transcriptional regulator n=1 Tax=Ampullimonas aquatilis TaxID=1341549 RepID=UPI003C787E6E